MNDTRSVATKSLTSRDARHVADITTTCNASRHRERHAKRSDEVAHLARRATCRRHPTQHHRDVTCWSRHGATPWKPPKTPQNDPSPGTPQKPPKNPLFRPLPGTPISGVPAGAKFATPGFSGFSARGGPGGFRGPYMYCINRILGKTPGAQKCTFSWVFNNSPIRDTFLDSFWSNPKSTLFQGPPKNPLF